VNTSKLASGLPSLMRTLGAHLQQTKRCPSLSSSVAVVGVGESLRRDRICLTAADARGECANSNLSGLILRAYSQVDSQRWRRASGSEMNIPSMPSRSVCNQVQCRRKHAPPMSRIMNLRQSTIGLQNPHEVIPPVDYGNGSLDAMTDSSTRWRPSIQVWIVAPSLKMS
ncbi:hypothetical protein BDN71DRAFT_1459110, partial [Pleurotus eryngii]